MGQTKEIIVKFESIQPLRDRREFTSALSDLVHVGVYLENADAGICKFFLRPLAQSTGPQFIDGTAARIHKWLKARGSPSFVDLYDATGSPIRKVDGFTA
jgi:hypothetical protein